MTIRIGITMGDPAGVGPEIALKAVAALAPRVAAGAYALTVVGSTAVLEAEARRLGLGAAFVAGSGAGTGEGTSGAFPLVSVIEAAAPAVPIAPGEVAAEAGRLAYHAVAEAVRCAVAGTIDAIATAPISKEALNLAGYRYSGHTDMLADLTQSRDSCMMLAHDRLRVTHVSTHVALAKVPQLVTRERVSRVLELTFAALADLGVPAPRVAVAALNPHAGEGGMFGREDTEVLVPVIEAWRGRGYGVSGPWPGDTVFVKAVAGQFDAVVAMFHDQGHIPVKLLGFHIDPATQAWTGLSGVNVTLGLPIIRTSVDHGTAFDIAGKGVANAQSMVEAIEYAAKLATGRRQPGRRAS